LPSSRWRGGNPKGKSREKPAAKRKIIRAPPKEVRELREENLPSGGRGKQKTIPLPKEKQGGRSPGKKGGSARMTRKPKGKHRHKRDSVKGRKNVAGVAIVAFECGEKGEGPENSRHLGKQRRRKAILLPRP